MNMQQEMCTRLATLNPKVFEFSDDSDQHAGHAGSSSGGHYSVVVASELFDGLSRLNRQRLVKDALSDLFQSGQIHALSIFAVRPDEYFSG